MSILQALTTTHWFPIGPSPVATGNVGLGLADGRIEAVAPDPANPDVMYAGATNGGVWKTGVWGNDPPVWLPLTDDQRSLNFAGYHPLVVHPANSQVLGAVSGAGAGVLRSGNGGLSWQLLGNAVFEGASIGSIALHPANPNVLWVAVRSGGPAGGVYKSTNGGQSWASTTSGIDGRFTDVVAARWDPQTLFAGVVAGQAPGLQEHGRRRELEPPDGCPRRRVQPGRPEEVLDPARVRGEDRCPLRGLPLPRRGEELRDPPPADEQRRRELDCPEPVGRQARGSSVAPAPRRRPGERQARVRERRLLAARRAPTRAPRGRAPTWSGRRRSATTG